MRIAVVAFETSHRTARAGIARTETLARALSRRGHDVTVFCAQWWYGPDAGPWRVDDDLRFRRIDIAPDVPTAVARLPAQLARFGPDVVHATPTPPAVLVAARAGATLARAPLVCDWYGDERFDSPLDGPARRAPTHSIVPSEYVESGLRERGVSSDDLTVLPEFLAFETIESVDPAGEANIVAGRRLDADANLESLFLGLAELRREDWSVTVIGDGPARSEFEQAAADLRIADRVTFVGDIPRAERIAHYRSAHTFVHTARRESFATELMWALACGCTGVVEYQGDSAAHELVERRPRGFRVTTSEEIAGAIQDARELDRRTIDRSLSAFDREQVLGRLIGLYRELDASH
ncbi:glycosyl transferase family 1 [Halobacteriales archaeon SW_6_65_46]|nr:MAG: glycosyl transferase family 1 [Halobacteriales archaeon SW_6_65_46]